MKLEMFILILIFAPELAIAQEMAHQEIVPVSMNEQAIAFQSQPDHYMQIAYVTPAEKSIIEVNAMVARKKFTTDRNLYAEIQQIAPLGDGIIDDWRERVYKTLGMYSGPRQLDLMNDSRLRSNNELDEQTNASRMASKIVLKETLRFTQERLSEIDKLVKALKFEVSTDSISGEIVKTATDNIKNNAARVGHHPADGDRFFLKTGLRLPIESGRLCLVSETEARYGNVSSFFSVYLDGQFDNRLGLIYVLGTDLQFQVEREIMHTTDPLTSARTNEKSSINLIQLVCKF